MKVVISGSSGLIGTALASALAGDGHEVIRLVRREPGPGEVRWDPQPAGGGLDPAALDGVDAVVHLSGAPVAGAPWTQARKQVLRSSRIQSTTALVTALTRAPRPPSVLLSASAVGWYGDTGAREADESAPNGTGFLPSLVADWEAAAQPAREAGLRVVTLRSGIVLSRSGGMLRPLSLPFRLGLGARLGPGTQYISWISLTDQIAAIRYLIGNERVEGAVNLTAPAPVTNAVFTAELARVLHRPAVLRSQRVVPRRLLESGFEFQQADIASALAAELTR
jgi:uncharacterized protein